MKRVTLSIAAVSAALILGCAPAVQTGKRAADAPADAQQQQPDADAHKRYSAGGQTFLDTLNRGKELALAPDDLPKLEVAPPPPTAPAPAQSPQTQASAATETATAETRFRIQILSAGQADMVRKEKANAANTLGLPVFMASEQSQFKLYVGEFDTKAEAEKALPEVKKKGYKDAWIITTKKSLQN